MVTLEEVTVIDAPLERCFDLARSVEVHAAGNVHFGEQAVPFSPDRGGVFGVFLALVRFGLGGASGDGRQFVSWIHDLDFIRAIEFLIAREDLSGPVNLASPNPLPNAEFMRVLRQAWGVPAGLPSAGWMIEVGTFLMRTESELVLKSRRVVPGRLLEAGFEFKHPVWDEAARDLVRRWITQRH